LFLFLSVPQSTPRNWNFRCLSNRRIGTRPNYSIK
jgi:hypothetical protein